MKRQILISSLILLSIQTLGAAAIRPVPQQYPTIQSAINASNDGDIVVVAPGVYSGSGNTNIDFHGLAITVQSQINPANPNPDIIANTIIDCQGSRDHRRRAFQFHNGEGPNSEVLGFTIRNAYWVEHIGADGAFGYYGDPLSDFIPVSVDPDADVNTLPPMALPGSSAIGDSYGGAILCGDPFDPSAWGSPTIQYCVIENCTVTGAQGGDGANGLNGTWFHWTLGDEDPCFPGLIDPTAEMTENDDGQWGGWGGSGYGNGYGGVIACLGGSSPIISDCTISNNFARGGCGGNGGNGGYAAQPDPPGYAGSESGGGDAGLGFGDGIGGAIYCDSNSIPIIANCTFSNNIATTGVRGIGGQRGLGNPTDPRTPSGSDGLLVSAGGIAGGVVYLRTGSQANFTNCTFTGNKSYRAYVYYDPLVYPFPEEDIAEYMVGGALYSRANNTVIFNNCEFKDNLGGAVRCASNCTLNINNTYDPTRNCLFTGNSEAANGGALYIDTGCTVDIQNCIFGGNSAYDDGGALKCRSNATFTNCSFGGNVADSDNDGYGYGGAIDAYQSGTTLILDFINCGFIGNRAVYGGGLSSEDFVANFTNCYFIDNTAEEGGGLNLANGRILFTDGVVSGNNAADGYGGGLMCSVTEAEIRNCTIMENYGAGNGGAICFYGGFVTHLVKNCLITDNTAAAYGGGISCEFWASPEIQNCTFSSNFTDSLGGAIFSDWSSLPQITDCILEGCNGHAIHEEDYGGDATVAFSLFYNNPNGDYYDSGTQLVYTGPGQVGSIPGGSNNLYGNPLFVNGDFGGYYLSQMAAGQGSDSPAIDNGSDTAVNLGLDTFTTRTDNVGDSGQVDRGYHYPDSAGVGFFQLTASVIGGHGTIEPTSGTYYMGTIVTLTAEPDVGWQVKAWSGTDDDSSTDLTNTVIMYSDRVVTVSFKQAAQTITVGIDGDFPTIEAALGVANDGDTIIVSPGTYYGPAIQVDKPVTIRSQDPNNPEATIIDGTEYVDRAFTFSGSGIILHGFTIQNCWWQPGQVVDPEPCPGLNGIDGPGVYGGAILIYPDASPVIKNCIIRNNRMRGGDASDGCASTPDYNAGRGGWGGWAWGGGVYCGPNSKPIFINCQIVDNHAGGGNGGDGGDDPGADTWRPNYGGNWSAPSSPYVGDLYPPWPDIHPEDTTIELLPVGMGLWEAWQSYPWVDIYGNLRTDYIGDYRWYSAYGGGVFCDVNSTVTFIDCTISGNRTSGGLSGEGGLWFGQTEEDNELEPEISFQLPSFGGGVYCNANSTVSFTRCTITDNVSVRPDADLDAYFNPDPVEPEPRVFYHLDPYTGHGGGVCAERTAAVTFNDCIVSGNEASVGGGVYWKEANVKLIDSDVISNRAYNGGGLFGKIGLATVIGCNISGNEAFGDVTDPNGEDNDPNAYDPSNNYYLPGSGGGIYCESAPVQIADSNISRNTAGASGGGVYLSGPNSPLLTNCLLAYNRAGKDGGGISANFLSQLTISVSTIVSNLVLGTDFTTMLGGGLYNSDGANTSIIGSILWDNYSAGPGDQIAIGNNPSPAAVSVSYSDIQDGATGVFIAPGSTLQWDDVNNLTGTVGDPDSEPVFVTGRMGGYYLSQPDANEQQTILSPCVDAGSDDALALGLYRHTTRTDEMIDSGIADIGYHYILTTDLVGDFDFNGEVNLDDLAIFNQHWMETGCHFPDWCYGTDLNKDGRVNGIDYAIFTANFKGTETTAPEPNPMTWAVPPISAGLSSIAMTATTAKDNSGTTVEYYFDCAYGGCHDRNWDPCSTYTDTGLVVDTKYGYRVKARDTSANLNETGWSFIGYAIPSETPPDSTPPTPDPMTWAVPSYTATEDSITLFATTATDTAGVKYYFANDSSGVNSGWIDEPEWTNVNLTADTTYTYRVKARDKSFWQNETGWSGPLDATTLEEGEEPNEPAGDTTPPAPVEWLIEPFETGGGMDAYANMTAAVATDPEGNGVQYYFQCVDVPGIFSGDCDDPIGFSSGWIDVPVWNDICIGRDNQGLRFRFKVRDLSPNLNESAWSTTVHCFPLD